MNKFFHTFLYKNTKYKDVLSSQYYIQRTGLNIPRLHYGYGLKFLKADYIKRKSRRKISKMGHMSKIYTKKDFLYKKLSLEGGFRL